MSDERDKLMFDVNEFLLKEYDCVFTVDALGRVMKIIDAHQEKALASILKDQDRNTRHACSEAIESEREKWPHIDGTDIISIDAAQRACMNCVTHKD